MIKNIFKLSVFVLLLSTGIVVGIFFRQTPEAPEEQVGEHELKIGAWTPYWNQETALPRLKESLPKLDSISPFVYEFNEQNEVYLRANLDSLEWRSILGSAEETGVEIIPTITTHEPLIIREISETPYARARHVAELEAVLDAYPEFTGIDIDYEEAAAEDFVHLEQLYAEIAAMLESKQKTMACSVSIWLPEDPTANFFSGSIPLKALEHCDRVRIMAYDQRRGFEAFNKKHAGELYVPVGDMEWITATLEYALQFFEPSEIELGIATYGYLYRVENENYERMRYLTHDHFVELGKSMGKTIGRAVSGEAVFYYDDFIAISADAKYIELISDIAKRHGVYGVMLFSIDGKEDESIL